MERVIKFRGKRIDNGEWVYGSLIQLLDPCVGQPTYKTTLIHNGVNISDGIPVRPETVGMMSGIVYDNGENVYEGDIAAPKSFVKAKGFYGVIEFKNGMFCYSQSVFHPNIKPLYESFKMAYKAGNEYTRLGNIHDNPELLKVTNCVTK